MKKINIIAPIYNEEGNIEELYRQLDEFSKEYEKTIDFNFIFVNDGSKDNSHQKILEIEDDRLIYLKFSKNFGKEAAIIAGLDESINADAATIIDSDLEIPLYNIKTMIEMWEEGTKLIISKRDKRNTSKLKSFLAEKYYQVFKKITKQDMVQDALDFVFMDNQVITEVVKQREQNRFFKGIIAAIGFDYKIIEIKFAKRLSGESSYNSFIPLFKYAFMSLAIYTKIPLYVGIYTGVISAFFGFLYGIVIIINYFIFGITVQGYNSIMCTLLFFFGMILMVLGIIGYYVGMILDETQNRQLYIIEKRYAKEHNA